MSQPVNRSERRATPWIRGGRTSRISVGLAASIAWLTLVGGAAASPALKLGVSLAVTGPDADRGVPMLRGVQLAVEDVNRRGGAGGHPLETLVMDSGIPVADSLERQRLVKGQYEGFIADPAVIAVVGPQTSLESRAVAALLSRVRLATITPARRRSTSRIPRSRRLSGQRARRATSERSAPI